VKALITKRSVFIASVSFFIALVTLVSVNVFSSAGPVTGFANTVTRPVRALASTVARTFGNIFASIYRYEELERRYEESLRTIARLQADTREAIALAEENAQLRAALGFRRRHAGYDQVMAQLENWNADNFSHSFNINLGYSNSSIKKGMGVVTEYGVLIGQVSDVGSVSSTVITVLDTTFSAAVFIGGNTGEDADGTAVLKGDFAYMRSGLLIIDFIDEGSIVTPGSIIVTSGHGGVFPPGLTVGEVVSIHTHSSGLSQFATVRPLRPIETIQTMFVILDFENTDNYDAVGFDDFDDFDYYDDSGFILPDDYDD